MVWKVKILLAKIKDCKGRDLKLLNKKILLTTMRPKNLKVYKILVKKGDIFRNAYRAYGYQSKAFWQGIALGSE
jgi:hypothetical protein